ncbi:hypothetical protein BDF14DRAFT_1783165 [Spinellus fusiger]|nr:hypothetical protein BDF14DRAFT_1783165 [Spinellus fusiger]
MQAFLLFIIAIKHIKCTQRFHLLCSSFCYIWSRDGFFSKGYHQHQNKVYFVQALVLPRGKVRLDTGEYFFLYVKKVNNVRRLPLFANPITRTARYWPRIRYGLPQNIKYKLGSFQKTTTKKT